MLHRLKERLHRRRVDRVLAAGDHAGDWSVEDFATTPPVEVPPQIVHLAAHLEAFSPERWQVLAAAETPNGFPACWSRWYTRPTMRWIDFQEMCVKAGEAYVLEGTPIEHSLILSEWEMPADESFMAPAPC
jgi:hypothetical protein